MRHPDRAEKHGSTCGDVLIMQMDQETVEMPCPSHGEACAIVLRVPRLLPSEAAAKCSIHMRCGDLSL